MVVEDEACVARVLVKALAPHGRVDLVTSVAQARGAMETNVFSAIIVDVGLPDGSGLDLVAVVRGRDPKVPVLVVSGRVDADRLAEAHALDVHYLLKPVESRELALFVDRARKHAEHRRSRTEALIVEWTALYQLTPSEADVLRLAALGLDRGELAEARNVAPSTIKKHVQTLLAKLGAPSLDVAVIRLLLAALDAS